LEQKEATYAKMTSDTDSFF